jgi:hypothetical protein
MSDKTIYYVHDNYEEGKLLSPFYKKVIRGKGEALYFYTPVDNNWRFSLNDYPLFYEKLKEIPEDKFNKLLLIYKLGK